jgi:hypothetical protein
MHSKSCQHIYDWNILSDTRFVRFRASLTTKSYFFPFLIFNMSYDMLASYMTCRLARILTRHLSLSLLLTGIALVLLGSYSHPIHIHQHSHQSSFSTLSNMNNHAPCHLVMTALYGVGTPLGVLRKRACVSA